MEKFIQIVHAKTDTNSHPTIPFIPPGGIITPTPTPTPTTGPTIILEANKGIYKVGESGKISVIIDSAKIEIDEFTIVIEYNPQHIQVLDSGFTETGTQINFLDTHFKTITNGNKVETNVTNSENKLAGRITIHARAKDDVSTTLTSRTVAEVNFLVLSSRVSEVYISKNSSFLLLDNTNYLDKNSLQTLTINSQGQVVTTITPSVIPTIPETNLSDPSSIILLFGSSLFIISGLYLHKKVKERRIKVKR